MMRPAPKCPLLGLGHVYILALVIVSMLGSSAIQAQPKPAQQINTTVQGAQLDPAVATQSTGEKFFVWGEGARRFEADGTPRDILEFDPGVGIQPDVAMNEQGDVVLVGEVDAEIQARLYTFDDSLPPSDLIGVSPLAPGEEQRFPSVAMDATGSFAVIYLSSLPGAATTLSLRRFDPGGMPIGAAQAVNTSNVGVGSADVAMRPDGVFAVAWREGGALFPGSSAAARLRFYGNDGTPLTAPILLSPEVAHAQGLAFTPTGTLIVTFHTLDGIWSAIYDTGGQLVAGPSFLFEATPGNRPNDTRVAAFDSGEFQITWDQGNGMADTFSLRLETDGSAQGSPFLVHLDTTELQRDSDIAAIGNEAIIVFEDFDADSAGISAACFLPDGCVEVFVDGFESGTTASWSNALPLSTPHG